jgi:hypothetical protein
MTDRIYLASNDGLVICLHDRTYPKPMRVTTVEPKKPAAAKPEEKEPADRAPAKPEEKEKMPADQGDKKKPEK